MFRNRYILSVITLLIVFTVIVSYKSLAGFFDDSIDFDKGAVAAWWTSDGSDYVKVEHCSIISEHNTYLGCENGQAHFISERWVDQPEQIIVTGVAKYEGNGYVRFRSTGGNLTLNGDHHTTLTSRTISGKPAGSRPSLKTEGKPGKKKPVYTLVQGTGTIESTVYSLDPPTVPGSYTLTVNSGDALGDGFEASGGAYVEISVGGSITGVEVTGTIGTTVEWSKGRESTSTGILSKSWNWNVRKTGECDVHDGDFFINSPHDHHWTCPTSNGCGKHIACGVPESNIPDEHKLYATCWNSGNGCTETNIRKCTHDCSYDANNPSSPGGTPGTGGGTGGTQPPNNPPPSPSYHPCDVHLTSVSGDHSLQASCPSTNENGNCTVTNFYACDGHTHTYPEPTLVACGRRRCTERVSERNKHLVDPCSACSQTYWSCGPHAEYHKNQHRSRTCRRKGCGNTWRRCQGPTPRCSVASGQGCWAK